MGLMSQPQNSMLAEVSDFEEACKKLLQTKHYAEKLGSGGIHAVLARAKPLGLHPMEALNFGFYVVQGRVGMSTELMAALARRKGHSIRKDPKSTPTCVILHGKRADNGDEWTCSFSKEDAQAAGLWDGPTWKKYPQVMLYNRCMSMLFRQLFPDLSLGAGYDRDELEEITKNNVSLDDLPEANATVESTPEPKQTIATLPEATPISEIISAAQAKELCAALELCGDGFKKSFLEGWKNLGVDADFTNLPAKFFNKCKAVLQENQILEAPK